MNQKNELTSRGARLFLFRLLVTTIIAGACVAAAGPAPQASSSQTSLDGHRLARSIAGQEMPAPLRTGTPKRSARSEAGKAAYAGASSPGVYHPLERGTTLCMLSKAYGVPVEKLMEVNRIFDPTSIPAGEPIFVPGATEVRRVKPRADAGFLFARPLGGCITSAYGATERRAHHAGIDIDGNEGDPILAAADGRVVRIEDGPHYGLLIVLEHAGGYATLYAHASTLLAGAGEWIWRGQVIALVGNSGNAHGSHLHFEVRRHGRPVNPLPLLEKSGRATPVSGAAKRSSPRSAS